MEKKSFRIELKNPCVQNWDAMPLVNGGLYCSECTKVVTDFTTMSDEALIQFLSQNRSGEICGKFYKHQLEKKYNLSAYKPQRSYHSLKLLLAGLLTLPLSIEAQLSGSQKSKMNVTSGQKKQGTLSQVHKKIIRGKVLNRSNYSGIRATIKLYASNSDKEFIATFSTDDLGHYTILLPDAGLSKFFRLVYSSDSNYLERTIVVDRDKAPSYLPVSLLSVVTVEVVTDAIELDESYLTTGGVYMRERTYETGGIPALHNDIIHVKSPLYKRLWFRIKGTVRKVFRRNK